MATTYDVRFQKTDVWRGAKTTTHWVRWAVAGKPYKKPFKTAALGDSFRSHLLTAARTGEAFDTDTGLPVSLSHPREGMGWIDFTQSYIDSRWKDDAAATRRSRVDAMTAITMGTLGQNCGPYEPGELRSHLQNWAFNTKNRMAADPSSDVAQMLSWVRRHTPNVAKLGERESLRRVLDFLAWKHDGTRAAPNYFNRRRAVLRNALEYARKDLQLFTQNPMDDVDATWAAPKQARTTVDRRTVVNPTQAARLINALEELDMAGGSRIRTDCAPLKGILRVDVLLGTTTRGSGKPPRFEFGYPY